jgi:hypothetical protein
MHGRMVFMSGGGDFVMDARPALRRRRLSIFVLGAALGVMTALSLAMLPSVTAPGSHLRGHRSGLGTAAPPLPASLAAAASARIGASEQRFWTTRRGGSVVARGGGIESTFTASGAQLRVKQGTVGVSLMGVSRGRDVRSPAAVAPAAAKNQALYSYGPVSAFYRNGPYGLEQGFTVAGPRVGNELVLALGLSGSLRPEQHGSQILFKADSGVTALSYGELEAVDGLGRALPAHMRIQNGTLELQVDTRGAHSPIRIDPFIQQATKLVGTGQQGGAEFGAEFGVDAALSADGTTALVGGREDDGGYGAVWVFTRSGETWTQQGPKLTGSEEVKLFPSEVLFGESVALSADGNTALIGGRGDNGQTGAAWVFTRSGETWTQQGPKLTGNGETHQAEFGSSVALSADGNTALIGGWGYEFGRGAAWVFTRSGETWTQQGEKLTPTEADGEDQFGSGISLSGDGDTAMIGAPADHKWIGAAYVFVRSGESWTQQGPKLTGTGEIGEGGFGRSALSADGNTALIGAAEDDHKLGAVWVFTRFGETWTQQGPKLTGGGESGEGLFGYDIALSGDGNRALIGAPNDHHEVGALWVFTRVGEIWVQAGEKLTATEEVGKDSFPLSLALSADGNTGLAGGLNNQPVNDAAWAFAVTPAPPPPPSITRLSVRKGPVSGGTSVTITGAAFAGAASVEFGSVPAESYQINSNTSVTAVSPEEPLGAVEVTVTTPGGTSGPTGRDRFAFKKVKKKR